MHRNVFGKLFRKTMIASIWGGVHACACPLSYERRERQREGETEERGRKSRPYGGHPNQQTAVPYLPLAELVHPELEVSLACCQRSYTGGVSSASGGGGVP